MESKIKSKVLIGLIAFLVLVVMAMNITCGILFELITGFLCGSGITISGEVAEQALAASDELCREIAEEGIVLVQNNDETLPMTKSELSQINVFGWRSINNGWIGGASGSVNGNNNSVRSKIKSFLTVLEENSFEYNTELTNMYEKFCNIGDGKALNDGAAFFKIKEPDKSYYTDTILQNAKNFSDTAFVVLGRQGGEGQDLPKYQWNWKTDAKDTSRTYLDITKDEEDLLNMVTTNFEKVIVIVNSCNGFNYNFLKKYENIDACLWLSGSGQSGAYSLVRMLRGKITPSGKFTTINPYEFNTDPTFFNHPQESAGQITYVEDIYVGYRWYETADAENYWNGKTLSYETLKQNGSKSTFTASGYDAVVQFPFGYGLSYTNFEWNVENVSKLPTSFDGKNDITIEVTVTNVGERKGKDIVQMYVTPPYQNGEIEKSAVNLVAFAKTDLLLPGDSETVKLTYNPYQTASYDCYDKNNNGFRGYELDAGDYVLSLRTDSHNLANCANSEITLNLAQGVQFDKDPTTGNSVQNRFTNSTGVTAYGGCAIDGSDGDQGSVNYLSRSNFAGSFPTGRDVKHSGSKVSAGDSYIYNNFSFSAMPTTGNGSAGELLLYTNTDGSPADADHLKSGKDIKINHDLMMELGEDFNSPKWDALLNQLSMADMQSLITMGGYRTMNVVSIGKKYLLDNDGGSGLNRHIQEADPDSFDSSERSSWTLFPSTNLLACSWNLKTAYAYGLAIANEAVSTGVDGWYSPSCNMLRSPFDGRVSEYCSEDSLLAGYVTAYQVLGSMANGMYTYVKHFAVNETETGRTGIFTWLTEQSLRENYLRAFEITVKVGKTAGIMSSFNRLGATWTGGNRALLTDILRTEWGFNGCVITDYSNGGGYMQVKKGLYAGNDLWLSGGGIISNATFEENPVYVNVARQACKDILFPKCNAYYVSQTHDDSQDVIKSDTSAIIVREDPFAWWLLILAGFDIVAVAGLTVWTLAVLKIGFFKKKKDSESSFTEQN